MASVGNIPSAPLGPTLRTTALCGLLLSCTSPAQRVLGSQGEDDSPSNGTSGARDTSDDRSEYPVPVRPTPAEYVQPGSPVNLQPEDGCDFPEIESDCQDGFCRILPGCFIMGSPRNRPGAGRYSDVQVQVTLTHTFEMGQTEVTNKTWLETGFDDPLRDVDVAKCTDPECPLGNVNIYEVLTFLNRYSELRGLPPCYELPNCTGTFGSGPICNRHSGSADDLACERKEEDGLVCDGPFLTTDTPYLCEGYRLPTEAEWEYAARAGSQMATWLGDIAWEDPHLGFCKTPQPNLEPIAWYCANAGSKVHPVGQKWANGWGLFDIIGNMSEWTSTVMSFNGYGESPQVDPTGYWYDTVGYVDRNLFPIAIEEGEERAQSITTIRGGNALFDAILVNGEQRSFTQPFQGASVLGFRMVRTLF